MSPLPNSEETMTKSFLAIAGALACLALASAAPAQAGGGATSAPSRYSSTAHIARAHQSQWHAQSASVMIEEFSSSSAKASVSKR
jgi:hypothetical protein